MRLADIRRVAGRQVAGRLGPLGIAAGLLRGGRRAVEDPGTADYRWFLLLAGRARCRDEHGRWYQLGPGDCFVRAPHRAHRVERLSGGRELEFFLRVPARPWQILCEWGLVRPEQRFGHLGRESDLLAELWAWHQGLAVDADAPVLAEQLAGLQRLLARLHAAAPGLGSDPDRIASVLAQLGSRLDEPLAMADVARSCGLSLAALREVVRAHLGVTPKRYRIRRRVEAAAELLFDRRRSLAAIATRLGYPDAFALSKQFKQVMGLSPQAYREHMQ